MKKQKGININIPIVHCLYIPILFEVVTQLIPPCCEVHNVYQYWNPFNKNTMKHELLNIT